MIRFINASGDCGRMEKRNGNLDTDRSSNLHDARNKFNRCLTTKSAWKGKRGVKVPLCGIYLSIRNDEVLRILNEWQTQCLITTMKRPTP